MREIIMNSSYTSLVTTKEELDEDKTVTPLTRHGLVRSSDFLQRVSKFVSSVDGIILPQNCRLLKKVGRRRLLILEEEPSLRTITVDLDFNAVIEKLRITGKLQEYGFENFLLENKRPYKLQLSFPYIVYFVLVDGHNDVCALRVYFRLHPLSSTSDYLMLANLLNIPDTQNVCLGHRDDDRLEGKYSLIDSVDEALDRFWFNSFNVDYTANYKEYEKVPCVSDFLTWSYWSSKDPMFIFDVEWKKHSNTVQEEVDDFASERYNEEDGFSFQALQRLFSAPITVGTNEDGEQISDNICNSILLGRKQLTVGDSVKYDKKQYYVSSFKGVRGREPSLITLVDESGDKREIQNTQDMRNMFDKQFSQNPRRIRLNGATLKKGDIVRLDYPFSRYKMITDFRIARDGKFEARFGHDYYLLENLQCKVLDAKDLEVNGAKLIKGKEYLLSELDQMIRSPFTRAYIAKFQNIHASDVGNIIVNCVDNEGEKISVPLNSREKDSSVTYRTDEFRMDGLDFGEELPVFRVMNKLVSNERGWFLVRKGFGILDTTRSKGSKPSKESSFVIDNVLRNEGNEIYIPAYDLDIHFKVGDLVVVSNWEDPEEMLKVRRITKFELDKKELVLYIVSVDATNTEIKTPYIEFKKEHVYSGSVRKVSLQYRGIQAGTKIRANTSGIPNFPKKDTNMIMAFLMDTGREFPLILCSNCCTLWATEEVLLQFDAFLKGSPQWKKLKTAPINVDNIKLQMGDFIYDSYRENRDRPLKIVGGYYEHSTNVLFEITGSSLGYYTSGIGDTSRWVRFGFLTPRYTNVQQKKFPQKSVFPNMHGWYTECQESRLVIREIWRDHV